MLIFSVEEMQQLAIKLSGVLEGDECITLQGDLGAGKTTFIRALIEALNQDGVGVISPTFNLLQTYDVMLENGKKSVIWHYDLYRLEEPEEIEELALDDALDRGITIIEWPEMVMPWLPKDRIGIVIDFGEGSTNRNIHFEAHAESGARLKTIGLL